MGGKPNPSGADLALRKHVTASGEEGANYGPIYAVDGDLTTRWSSAFLDPQWIKVDLGAVWRVSDVRLAWERAYATAYRVDVSVDGKTWTTAFQTSSGAGGTDDLRIRAVPARYVRMYGLRRVGQYGYSLLALQVF
jgi:hypothetical protein